MTVHIIQADATDAWMQSFHATYATARTGSSVAVAGSTGNMRVGQVFSSPNYFIYVAFHKYPCGVIGHVEKASTAVLGLFGSSDIDSLGTWNIEAYAYNFGATVEAADWRSMDILATLPLLGSFGPTSGWNATGWNDLTSQSRFPGLVPGSGDFGVAFVSSRATGNLAPNAAGTPTEQIRWQGVSDANPPRLVVTTGAMTPEPPGVMRRRFALREYWRV